MENNKLLLGTLCLSIGLCHGAIAEETFPSAQTKVLNGETAVSLGNNLLPWQAAILTEDRTISQCGAVVISDYWLVTAAHCAEDAVGEINTIVAGTSYIPQGNAESLEPKYKFSIVDKIVHSDYRGTGGSEFIYPGDMDYDIALVKVDRKLTDLPTVTPIKIATPVEQTKANSEFANTWNATGYSPGNLIGSGWGKMEPNYNITNELRVVKLGGIPMSMCDASYQTTVNSRFVCADSNNPAIKKDVCKGDSGGPLIWQYKDQNNPNPSDFGLRLVGVTSNGPSCRLKNNGVESQQTNGLYTEVAAYYSWIEQNSGLDLDTLPTPKFNQNPFDLVKEDQQVSAGDDSSSGGSNSGGSIPLSALAMMALAAIFRRKK